MWQNLTFRKIIQLGLISLMLIITLAASSRISAALSLGVDTGNLSLDYNDNDSSNAKQPGCDTANCLTMPATKTYKGISDLTSFRSAIITFTNFALSFLSLIAMVALIYAGFLYVTAAGEDEPIGKAKKIIIYVVIGIIVILIAYALVSTLISGETGLEATTTQTQK